MTWRDLAVIPYCGPPPSPDSLPAIWNLDPVLIACLVAFAGLYTLGDSRNRRAEFPFSAGERLAFYAGWLIAALALVSPLCPLSVSLFAARVGQHMILTLVAAPLVAAGGPLQVIAAAFGATSWVRRWMRPAPLSAAALFAVLLWFWHAPSPYAGTFDSTFAYWTMHLTVIGSALWLWFGLLDRRGTTLMHRVAAGVVSTVQMGFLGALITLAPRPLYAPHALTTTAWGLNSASGPTARWRDHVGSRLCDLSRCRDADAVAGSVRAEPARGRARLMNRDDASREAEIARSRRQPALSILAALLAEPAGAATPLSYLRGFGAKAYPVTALTWGLIIISIIVIVVCTALVVIGAWRRRARGVGDAVERVPVERGPNGASWISIGVGISFVVLVASLVWTVIVLAAVNGPPHPAQVAIEVTGEQWWWKARYLSEDPSRIFTTANEIHIPTGEPIQVKLIGGDVIHSFWVPALTGKTDTIPGQANEMWFEADQAGRYRGQCTEFCGWQHAHMALFVVAEPRAVFDAWWDAQLQPAPAATSPAVEKGERSFAFHCGACHSVRGTEAGGTVAPDLTHLMSRSTIAAGMLSNTPAYLSGWIANPQDIKPGTRMPDLYLSGPELQDIRTFLATLK